VTEQHRKRRTSVLSPEQFFCQTRNLLTTKPRASRHVQQSTLLPRTTNYVLRTTHRFSTTHSPLPTSHIPHPTSHIPLPTPSVIPDERHKPRDLGSRPSHRPAMTVLRIGSTSNHREQATWLAVASSLLLLTRPSAHYALRHGPARAGLPARLAGMTNKEYSCSADEIGPGRNVFFLSLDR